MAEAGAHVNIFKNLEDSLKLVIKQIQDGENERSQTDQFKFNHEKYWKELGSVFQALSLEGTKLSLAFMKTPFPDAKESEAMAAKMEMMVLKLVSCFYSLPKTQGLTLRKSVQRTVVGVLESALMLVSYLAQFDPGAGERRQATGVVWEETGSFSRIPKNNCEAVEIILDQTAGLIKDALTELDEILESDGGHEDVFGDDEEDGPDNTETWTAQEKEMVAPVKGLVNTASKLIKKSKEANKKKAKCDSEDHIAQLDDLSDCAQRLSPAVDELISCMYAPVDHTAVRNNANALSDVTNNTLSVLRSSHLTDEADAKWLDFLNKANTHNLTTIVNFLDK